MNQNLDILYKSLYLTMEQEYERYQELLEAVEAEAGTLKSCTSSDVIDMNSRHERLLLSVRMAAEIRNDAINKIASFLNLDQPVTMTQLIAHAQDKTRKYLTDYKEKFADLISRIQKTNDHNKTMIAASLSHINNTLNYIDTLTSPNPNYNRKGQMRAGNLQSRLISEAG